MSISIHKKLIRRSMWLLPLCLLCTSPLDFTTSLPHSGLAYAGESKEAIHNLNLARKYKKQKRYELARQYYLLALAATTTTTTRDTIQRDLQVVELQIRTLR